jgi:hypothetical protein
MSMPDLKKADMKKLLFVFALALLLLGCRKEAPIYGVNNVDLDLIETSKTKLKTPNQFVAILYANLFQTALPVNKLVEITDLIDAIGDDQVAYEIIISNFMNMPTVQIPSNTDMRANPEHFIIETYKRFLIRRPTEAEKTYFINRINTNQNITAELVYFSFALSDEYQYY